MPVVKKTTGKRPTVQQPTADKVAPKKTTSSKASSEKSVDKTPPKGSNAASMLALREERLRKFRLVNEKMEREVALQGGNTILREEANEEITTANYAVRGSFSLFHKTLPKQLAGLTEEEMQPVIKGAVDRALNNLCETLEEHPP